MEKLMLILNPISGTMSKRGLVEKAESRLTQAGFHVDVELTTARGDATRLALKAVSLDYDAVVAAGGDGTVNETARSLCGSRVAMGILPTGSGNGLARHLDIPMDISKALAVIEEHHIIEADYGTVNRRPFFCTFGVGFDAAVSHRFAMQNRRGKMMYLKSAIDEYLHYHPQEYTISANGKVLTEKAFLIAVCNASQYGNNAYIAPEASITDGLLDFTIIHAGNPIDTALVGVDLLTGYINKNILIHSFKAPAAVITRHDEGPAHLDGEPVTLPDSMYIQCHHRNLKLFTPKISGEFRPLITPIRSFFNDFVYEIDKMFHR